MKISDTRLKKTIIVVVSTILIFFVIVVLLISPIAKYMIEKYDEKYLGRKITLGWVYLNPFTGYVHLGNLKVYESKNLHGYAGGDSIFFSANGVSANFSMLKLLSKNIEISEISLDHPRGIVIQNQRELNFSDLIKLFTPEKSHTAPSKVYFSILKIKIENGVFYYRENLTPVNYFIKDVNIESTGKRWNSDTIAVKFSFASGPGSGSADGNFTINFKTDDYRLAFAAHQFDLNIIGQYLKDLTNNGSFSANLDADVKTRGNFKDQENMTASGLVTINEFHFGSNPDDDFASFKKLVIAIIEVSPKNHKYLFDSVTLTHPHFKYERYDQMDNLQAMFGKNGARISAVTADPAKFNLVIEIARYVKVLARNFFRSDYKLNRLAIYNGDLKFNDYAVGEKFSVELNPMYITADSIDKNRKWAEVLFKSGIKPYGNANVSVKINPNDSTDFDLWYDIQKVPVAIFNPYLITYTSYPVDRGTIGLNGAWKVRNGMIRSSNHLVLIDPRVIRRVKNKGSGWIPLRLIMSLVRERGNVVDYEIPITGSLKDPEFHLHDVLMDVLENIFVKPATASYRLEVRNIELEIETSHTVTWKMRQDALEPDQEKFVGEIVDFLVRTPGAAITVYPMQYAEKEKEHILFFEAKKKYFLLVNHITDQTFGEKDSAKVDRMSVKDSVFVHYLNRVGRRAAMYTIQEKCNSFVGPALIDASFRQLNHEREASFLLPFTKKSVANRVKMKTGENTVPYNGFTYYKIVYKGEIPESLIRAHRKMNDLNNESPRKKFQKDRKKNGSVL